MSDEIYTHEVRALLGLNRRPKRDETVEYLDDLRWEEATDDVERLSQGFVDARGFPLEGFESPRYLDDRRRAYKAWYRGDSPEAARSRRIRAGGDA